MSDIIDGPGSVQGEGSLQFSDILAGFGPTRRTRGGLFELDEAPAQEELAERMLEDYDVRVVEDPSVEDMIQLSAPASLGFLYLGNLVTNLFDNMQGSGEEEEQTGLLDNILQRLGLGGAGGLSGLAGGAFRQIGRLLTNPVALAVAGVAVGAVMGIRGGLDAMQNAEYWEVGQGSAFLAGFLSGPESGWQGAGRGALQFGAMGAGIGFLIAGPIGAAVGGVAGAAVGAILGSLDSEEVAQYFDTLATNNREGAQEIAEGWQRLMDRVNGTFDDAFESIIQGTVLEDLSGRFQQSTLIPLLEQLQEASPELSDEQLQQIAIRQLRNMGVIGADGTIDRAVMRDQDDVRLETEAERDAAIAEAVARAIRNSDVEEGSTEAEQLRRDLEERFNENFYQTVEGLAQQALGTSAAIQRALSAPPAAPTGRPSWDTRRVDDGVFTVDRQFREGALFGPQGEGVRLNTADDMYLLASTNPANDRLREAVDALNSKMDMLGEAIAMYRPVTNNNTSNTTVQSSSIPYRELMSAT